MTWAVTAQMNLFSEAAAWFRTQIPVTEELADAYSDYAGSRAWTIAGVTQLSVVQSTFDKLTTAIEKGKPFEVWKQEVQADLTEQWGKQDSARVELIFRNATIQANNAGRWKAQSVPILQKVRPFLFFDGVGDTRQSDICEAWDGTVLPRDQYPSDMHPQLHHNCRSQLRAISEREAMRRGVTTALPDENADEGFGAEPGTDEFTPDRAKHWDKLFDEYQHKRQQLSTSTARPTLTE